MALDANHVTKQDPFGAPASNTGPMPLALEYRLVPLDMQPAARIAQPGVLQGGIGTLPDPKALIAAPSAPTLSVGGTGGTIPTGTAYVKLVWGTDFGYTTAGAEASIGITSGQNLTVTVPAFPNGVTKAIIGASTASNGETQQQVVTSPGQYTLSAISAGAALSTSNSATNDPIAVSQSQ